MEKEKEKVLKEGLSEFYGSIPLVAEETKRLRVGGYTQQYIRGVLAGRRKNDAILMVAAEVLADLRKKKAQVNEKLENLLTQMQSA